MLNELIEKHRAADAEFVRACNGETGEAENWWDAKEAAEMAVIRYPCRTFEEVREKIRWALADENVQDSITNCTIGEEKEHVGLIFIRSLLGGSVEKSNNGEN